MSKKHFKIMAKFLHDTKPVDSANKAQKAQWIEDIKAIANALALINPRFNNDLFIQACEEQKQI